MKQETYQLNPFMMEELQNHYAYSDYAIKLHHYLQGCYQWQQSIIKGNVFSILCTWSRVFDNESELFKEYPSEFWLELARVEDLIEKRLAECGFDYTIYPENSPF